MIWDTHCTCPNSWVSQINSQITGNLLRRHGLVNSMNSTGNGFDAVPQASSSRDVLNYDSRLAIGCLSDNDRYRHPTNRGLWKSAGM